MITASKLRYYFWYMFGTIGVAIFWAGISGGFKTLVGSLWVTLVIGLTMLIILSRLKQSLDPISKTQGAFHDTIHKLNSHPQKHEFHIKYFDKVKNEHILFSASELKSVEKSFLIFQHDLKEYFIPINRVKEILQNGQSFLKLEHKEDN